MPYIVDLTFYRYEFEKAGDQIKGYSISKINETIELSYIYIYIYVCIYIYI